MGIQQWLFSFKGRIGRRDFWIWTVIWVLAMAALFYAVSFELLASQNAAFMLVCLLWPTACVIVKRLHDRNKSGGWSLLLFLHGCCWQGTGRYLAVHGNGLLAASCQC